MRSDALKHIYFGAGLSLILRLAGTGVMFVALLLLARTLTADEFGLYIYIVDIVALAAPIATLGLSQICVRVVSDAISEENPHILHTYRKVALILTIVSSLVFWIALEGARIFGLLPSGLVGWLLPLSVLLLIAICILRLAQEMLRAAKHIGLSQVAEQLIWPVALLLLATCGFWELLVIPLSAVISLQIILMFVATMALIYAFNKLVLSRIRRQTRPERAVQLQEWLKIGLPLAAAGGLSLIQYRGDIIAMGAFAQQSELGPYAAAVRLAGLIIFALGAAAAASEPLMRQFHVVGERRNLQLVVDRAATISAVLSLPVAIPFMLYPEFFLSLFGSDFVKAGPALSILALGQLVNAMTGPISPLIIALGLQRVNLYVMAIVALGLMVGLILIVPYYGMLGAATVTAISAITLNCILARIIYVRTGIKTYFQISDLFTVIKDLRVRLQFLKSKI